MLAQPLIALLEEWKVKDLSFHNSAKYKSVPNPSLSGGFFVIVQRESKLNYSGIPKVSLKQSFATNVTDETDSTINPCTDESRLINFLSHFDSAFVKKVKDTESRIIEEMNPPGFF